MKISASLYSNKEKSLEELVQELDRYSIDSYHIDSNDDLSVMDDIRRIRQISSTPIDLHIISDQPEKYYALIEELEIEYVQIQYENLKHKINIPRQQKTQYGLAIVSDTSIEVFSEYEDQFNFILLMTTIPGQSGGLFQKENFQKIRKFRNNWPEKKIHVDGGVNDEVSFILRNMGVHSVVSGSFLLNNLSIGAALISLKTEDVKSHYKIRDFMIDFTDLPVLDIDQATFPQVLQTIEKYNLGFVFYIDQFHTLRGLSSNADVRKGLIKNLQDLNQTRIDDIINQNPVSLDQNATITDMLRLIKSKKFIISFLPVVNAKNQLKGAITFFNLIRGES
ncbi:MAG: CBS domain-containing protein [Candidatus Cyclobacteriaceae bacterium M3_2C_046]